MSELLLKQLKTWAKTKNGVLAQASEEDADTVDILVNEGGCVGRAAIGCVYRESGDYTYILYADEGRKALRLNSPALAADALFAVWRETNLPKWNCENTLVYSLKETGTYTKGVMQNCNDMTVRINMEAPDVGYTQNMTGDQVYDRECKLAAHIKKLLEQHPFVE